MMVCGLLPMLRGARVPLLALWLVAFVAVPTMDPGYAKAAEAAAATSRQTPLPGELDAAKWRGYAATILGHLYTVYQGIRSCTEISAEQNDRSFLSTVSIGEARDSLRRIDAAVAEVGIDSTVIWNEAMPRAVVTAEALKSEPASHVVYCQSMAQLFRVDAANLQNILATLGAKKAIIVKDY